MGEIVNIEDYRACREVEELHKLKEELDKRMEELPVLYPEPYFPLSGNEDYLLTAPLTDSLSTFNYSECPCCGYNSLSSAVSLGTGKDEP
jgi:hypothetical protein